MKNLICLVLFCISFSQSFSSGLKGTYTIDKSKAASSTNYVSFNDADSDLAYGTRASGGKAVGPGVSSAVTFNVANGIYRESVLFRLIKGASNKNRITFRSASGDSSKVTIVDSTVNIYDNPWYVLRFCNASFITFQKIGFVQKSQANSNNVLDMDSGCNNNYFENCRFAGVLGDFNFFGLTTYGYLVFNEGAQFYSNNNNVFNNNDFRNSEYGINWQGGYGGGDTGNVFENNHIDSVGAFGILISQQDSTTITNNKVIMRFGGIGMTLESTGNFDTAVSLVANNFIAFQGSINSVGMQIDYANYINITNNSINIDKSLSSFAMYVYNWYTPIYQHIYNNILSNTGKEGNYALYATYLDVEDNNDLYCASNTLVNYQGVDYADVKSWTKSGGVAIKDIDAYPFFTSWMDLHIRNSGLQGKAKTFTTVPKDIDGDKRVNATIGADEFTAPLINPVISAISKPAPGFCSGTRDVYVTLYNLGSKTISSATIEWSINGTSMTAYSSKDTLAPGDSVSLKMGSYSFSSGTIYKIISYPSKANATTVSSTSLNTFTWVTGSGLKGTYLIDNSGAGTPDYTSFRDAIKDLEFKGACGAVVFNVADGTYHEHVNINYIPGTSASNTVVFQSKSLDSTKVIIDSSGSFFNYKVTSSLLDIENASYVTFRKLSFTTDSLAFIIFIENNSKHINVQNSLLYYTVANKTSFGILESIGSYCQFEYNHINGGGSGINLYGNYAGKDRGNIVYHNVIDSVLYNGILLSDMDSTVISTNKILARQGYALGPGTFTGYDGIVIQQNVYLETDTTYILNNFLNSNWFYANGITIYGAFNLNIYNNSVSTGTISGGGSNPITIYSILNHINIFNNIFSTNNSSTAFCYSADTSKMKCDYNNYFTNGKSIGYMYTGNYNTLKDFHKDYLMDLHSIQANPDFVSINDLHLSGKSPDIHSGIKLAGINFDIDDEQRGIYPSIGADEIRFYANDAGILSIDSPSAVFCTGTKDVYVTLQNKGNNILSSVTVSWTVNGVAKTPYKWTGKLGVLGTLPIDLGAMSFSSGQIYNVIAWTEKPNGGKDSVPANDTSATKLSGGLNGSYSVGGASPDFLSFGESVAALNNFGVCGAVVFNVRDGYYNESLYLSAVKGASAGNTITYQSQSLDSSKVVLDTSSMNFATITLDGASYFNIRKMGISNFPFTNNRGNVIQITNGSSHNIFENNYILADTTYNLWLQLQGSLIYDDPKSVDEYNIIRNNAMAGMYDGIHLECPYGKIERGNVVEGNTIDSVKNAGIYAINQTDISITGNRILVTSNGFNGIYSNYIEGSSATSYANIINNFVSVLNTNGAAIFTFGGQYINIYYNSFYTRNRVLYGMRSEITGSNLNVINNIFSNDGLTGSVQFYNVTGTSNYNDFYSTGKIQATWNSTDCYTISDWRKASKLDSNSIMSAPMFLSDSTGDLHLTNFSTTVISSGKYLTAVSTDIDNDLRNKKAPCIGADEYLGGGDIGVDSILSPVNNMCGTNGNSVSVRVVNYGKADLSSFSVKVEIDTSYSSVLSVVGILRGKLSAKPHDTIVTISVPSWNSNAGGIFKIKAYTILPGDSVPADDTTSTSVNIIAAAKAGFTMASSKMCSGDSIAVKDKSSGGIKSYIYYLLDNLGNKMDSSSKASPVFKNNKGGVYRILQYVSNSSCSDSTSSPLTILQGPNARFGNNILCKGINISFTDSSIAGTRGISNYSWHLGNGSTSSGVSASTVYSVGGSVSVSLVVTDSNGCSDSVSHKLFVNSGPQARFVNASLCRYTSSIFTDSSSKGSSSITSYSWDLGNGSKSTVSSASTTYSSGGSVNVILKVSDSAGCVDSMTKSLVVDTTCVWPGDANADRVVDIKDILNIGVGFGTTGSARPGATIAWNGQFCNNWSDTFIHAVNYKNADCNGDSTINYSDTLAVSANFSKTHLKNVVRNQGKPGDPALTIHANRDSLQIGDTLVINVAYGNAANPAKNVYGLCFGINFNASLFDTSSMNIDYTRSWLAPYGKNQLHFSKSEFGNDIVYLALTRTNRKDTSGYGSICTIRLPVSASIPNSVNLCKLTLSDNYQIDVTGKNLPVYMTDDSIKVAPLFTGIYSIHEVNDDVSIYPNPFSKSTSINYILGKAEDVNIHVYDLTGRSIATLVNTNETAGSHSVIFNPSSYSSNPAGIYILSMKIGDRVSEYRLVNLK